MGTDSYSGDRSAEATDGVDDATVTRLLRASEDHALPLKLIYRGTTTKTVIVHDANGCCVLDTTTPSRADGMSDCDFDRFVVDAVNNVGALAREVQRLRAELRRGVASFPHPDDREEEILRTAKATDT